MQTSNKKKFLKKYFKIKLKKIKLIKTLKFFDFNNKKNSTIFRQIVSFV